MSNQNRFLKVTWPEFETSIRIELLEDKAPGVCRDIWDALPFSTIQGHALVTGEMLFATTPVTSRARENVTLYTELGIGGCYLGNSSQNIGIVYGNVTEPEGQTKWGQVVEEDITALRKVGVANWRNLVAPFGDLALNPDAKHPILVEFARFEGETRA